MHEHRAAERLAACEAVDPGDGIGRARITRREGGQRVVEMAGAPVVDAQPRDSTARSRTRASRIMPVKPRPPTLAQKTSAWSRREQDSISPSAVSSVKLSTKHENVPSR
jgi:hypothetical protein